MYSILEMMLKIFDRCDAAFQKAIMAMSEVLVSFCELMSVNSNQFAGRD
jgi:hypothetical protein